MGRTSIRLMLDNSNCDHRYYKEKGWCGRQSFDATKFLPHVLSCDRQRIMNSDLACKLNWVFSVHHRVELEPNYCESATAIAVCEPLVARHLFLARVDTTSPKSQQAPPCPCLETARDVRFPWLRSVAAGRGAARLFSGWFNGSDESTHELRVHLRSDCLNINSFIEQEGHFYTYRTMRFRGCGGGSL